MLIVAILITGLIGAGITAFMASKKASEELPTYSYQRAICLLMPGLNLPYVIFTTTRKTSRSIPPPIIPSTFHNMIRRSLPIRLTFVARQLLMRRIGNKSTSLLDSPKMTEGFCILALKGLQRAAARMYSPFLRQIWRSNPRNKAALFSKLLLDPSSAVFHKRPIFLFYASPLITHFVHCVKCII